MGRPLNKKYFGNRNIGTGGYQVTGDLSNSQNYADDRIGGEGVASYGTIVAGSGWTTAPTVTFSAPAIPGGVSVAGTAHYKALSFATTANGTGYNVGDVVEVHTGTATTKARAPISEVLTVNVAKVAGGQDYEAGNTITMSGAGWSQALVITVDSVDGGGAILTFTVTQAGRRTVAVPANPVGGTTAQGTGLDANGQLATFNLTWGAYTFGAVSVAGDYTVFPSTGGSGTLDSVAPATGTGAKADITMGLLSIEVTEKGSGYVDAADAAVSFTGATGAAATAVLTTDSGSVGATTNQENAILMTAYLTGGSAVTVDIIKQVSTNRYKVTDGTRTGIVQLQSSLANAAGEGSIRLVDTDGGTYFATKITSRKAVITRGTGVQAAFVTGTNVKWNMTAATADSLKIDNA